MPGQAHRKLRPAAAFIAVSLGVLLVAVWWLAPGPKGYTTGDSPQSASAESNNIGLAWRWDHYQQSLEDRKEAKALSNKTKQNDPAEPEPAAEDFGFDVVVIYDALKEVKLTEQGDVVVDHDALLALEDSIRRLGPDVTGAQLDQLQELIKLGLPGEAGLQAAAIVRDYYHYSQAAEELHQSRPPAGNIAAVEEQHQQLKVLRESYLGAELANQLFAERDAMTEYTLAAMGIHQDGQLTEEEKAEKLAQLGETLPPSMLNEDKEAAASETSELGQTNPLTQSREWQQRFRLFDYEKQQVLGSSLSEEEKQSQIEDLLKQHFSGAEIEQARFYQPPPPDSEQKS